ncbi:hypothetical protein CCMSSC00406_0004430 [Pleurotus cornucopiae]|uniref:Uncharacterized protein n=1 Tax=Pleurotus cornucopiae TaxID=5321 RepID=A0ACB7J1Q6_PLECO|nr:hypothetical protein CCMSSC00406_0004430 [Pleurotus cornucopiae]
MRSSLIILAFATAAVVARPIEDGHSSLAIRGVESTYVVRAYDAEDGKIHDAIHGAIHKVAAFGKKLLGSKPKTAAAPAPAPADADASATTEAAAPADPAVAARDIDTEDGRIADAVHKAHTTLHNAVTSAIAFGKKLFSGKSKAAAPAPAADAAPETAPADTAAPAEPAA